MTIAPPSNVPITLHEFDNCKGHQGTIFTFEAIRRSCQWLKLHQDTVQDINKCDICSNNLLTMVKYPQTHLEIPQIPMAVLAIDTIAHLPGDSKDNKWPLTAISLNTSYVFTVSMKEKSAEIVIQAYLSGIHANEVGSVAILSDNGTEFTVMLLMKHVINLELKGYSPTHSTPR